MVCCVLCAVDGVCRGKDGKSKDAWAWHSNDSLIIIVIIFIIFASFHSLCLTGVALTPPMGWLSWERYACEIDVSSDLLLW